MGPKRETRTKLFFMNLIFSKSCQKTLLIHGINTQASNTSNNYIVNKDKHKHCLACSSSRLPCKSEAAWLGNVGNITII